VFVIGVSQPTLAHTLMPHFDPGIHNLMIPGNLGMLGGNYCTRWSRRGNYSEQRECCDSVTENAKLQRVSASSPGRSCFAPGEWQLSTEVLGGMAPIRGRGFDPGPIETTSRCSQKCWGVGCHIPHPYCGLGVKSELGTICMNGASLRCSDG
jgi:hypothetical protein